MHIDSAGEGHTHQLGKCADSADTQVTPDMSRLSHACTCMHMYRDGAGHVTSIEAKLVLDDTDYKNTKKLTWLAETSHAPFTPTVCIHFDHLITKGVLKPDEDFKDFVNRNSKVWGVSFMPICHMRVTCIRFPMRCLETHYYGN